MSVRVRKENGRARRGLRGGVSRSVQGINRSTAAQARRGRELIVPVGGGYSAGVCVALIAPRLADP